MTHCTSKVCPAILAEKGCALHGSVHKAMNQLLGDLHRSRQQRKKLTESVFEVPMGAGSAPVRVLLREKHGACLGTSLWASSEVLTEYLGAHHLPALGERVGSPIGISRA